MGDESGTERDPIGDLGDTADRPGDDGGDTVPGEFPEESEHEPAQLTSIPTWAVVILVAFALLGGYLLGRPSYPLDTGADAGFLRDMSVHHNQAVDMSMIILEKTEDPELRTVATDMARTQQAQVGRMQGWLLAWDLPVRAPDRPMAWMAGHEHSDGSGDGIPETMPGLATEEQLDELRGAEGVEAEIVFLELMTAHHLGGIVMAEAEADLGREAMVVGFAEGMIEAQGAEVDLMERMLADRTGG
ncbi:Uncharacterized conserved protein, DUF305 family [Nocardiopsis flavescens]|uniref:Uncharacterized conserved protein, DUF305 family n=1 Tax=Nocardiopsis flavescens TaxID=758803 RepID=A0A1M6KL57_9ACTN|nr:DUF305 domain-containing protein [Nocardiopsis flavescens]SHJ59684.1 Uncharacterized conserved protein, DUF305 family [Nocardiopsis flavescens]